MIDQIMQIVSMSNIETMMNEMNQIKNDLFGKYHAIYVRYIYKQIDNNGYKLNNRCKVLSKVYELSNLRL